MPLSADPVARAAQLANLRSGAAKTTHGALSEALIQQATTMYLAELSREFPGASERVLRLQARRLSKLDRLASYLEGRGEIRNRRTGEVFAASALEERITGAYLATHERLEQQREQVGTGSPLAGLADAGRLVRLGRGQ